MAVRRMLQTVPSHRTGRDRTVDWREIVDAVSDGVLTFTGDGVIRSANSAAGLMFGRDPARMLGGNVADLIQSDSGADKAGFAAWLAETAAAGKPRPAVGHRGDGRVFTLDIAVGALKSPRARRFVATIREHAPSVTSTAERTAMAEWVAHDVGNILNSMLACADYVRGELPDDSPLNGVLASAVSVGMRGQEVVGQLRALKSGTDLAVMDLCPVIRDSAALLKGFEAAGLSVSLDLPGDPCLVVANSIQIYQVAINLLINAAQMLVPTGGAITVGLGVACPGRDWQEDAGSVWGAGGAVFRLGHPGQDECVRLSVRDNGPGIEAALLPRIFQPFFTTRGGDGSGLGLAVVEKVVRQCGGAIRVDTCPGAGTVFEIWLARALSE